MKHSVLLATACLATLVLACKPDSTEPNSPNSPSSPSSPSSEPATIAVLSVRLDKNELPLNVGESLKLVATVIPEDATNQEVSWKSDNESVATVAQDGTVTAVAEGSAKITVTTRDGGKTDDCAVTVSDTKEKIQLQTVDGVIINHTYGIYEDLLEMTWNEVADATGYVLKVSVSENMADAVETELPAAASATFTVKEFNHIAAKAGVKPGQETKLYVQLSDKEGQAVPGKATISVTTEFGSFEDPRDGEIYMTVEVGDFTWMCENLRATKYSDGEPLYDGGASEAQLHSLEYNDGALGKKVGVYYAFANAVRAFYGSVYPYVPSDMTNSIQVQGICPDGWHVTAKDDWYYLLESACELTGEEMGDWLDRSKVWAGGSLDAINKLFSAKELTFGTDEAFTNDLGVYLMIGGMYNYPTSNVAESEPSEYNFRAYYWSATMDDGGGYWSNIVPALTPRAAEQGAYFAHRADLHPTYGQSMPVRCVKNY